MNPARCCRRLSEAVLQRRAHAAQPVDAASATTP